MSGKRELVIKEIEEIEDNIKEDTPPDLVSDDDDEDFDAEDFNDSDEDSEDESEEEEEDDVEAEEEENLGALFQYFFTNDNGENVADILTGLKDSIDTHNKLIYKLMKSGK